jgi:hypothetical protein
LPNKDDKLIKEYDNPEKPDDRMITAGLQEWLTR